MKLFGQLIKTAVNLATLPVDIAKDIVTAFPDACEGKSAGESTKRKLRKLKDEAEEK